MASGVTESLFWGSQRGGGGADLRNDLLCTIKSQMDGPMGDHDVNGGGGGSWPSIHPHSYATGKGWLMVGFVPTTGVLYNSFL